MNLHDLGEFGLITHLATRLAQRGGVRLGIGDDAAVLNALDAPIVTCDALVENVHFRRDWSSPRQLGRKALAVNVSDIAAMGGCPVAAFLSLALGPHDDLAWVEQLYAGLEEAAALYGLTVAGGDTVRSPLATMLSIALIGNAPRPILRSGAQPGDLLLVTGTLGDSAAGLALLQDFQGADALPDRDRAFLLERHLDPRARLNEMKAVLSAGAEQLLISAALDLSDGLAGDAAHIARASSVSLEIEVAHLPLSSACRQAAAALHKDAHEWALRGGEDYELLLCVAPDNSARVAEVIQDATGTPVTIIGRCVAPKAEPIVILLWPDGRSETARGAWTHF